MKVSEELRIRDMTSTDVPALMRLKGFPGWNQAPGDWQAFMKIEPGGCFVGEIGGDVVTSATAFNYDSRFGWIGMILVDPAVRRQGIGTRMMHTAIDYLESVSCICQKLDATADGARVYEKIGFQVEYQVERWVKRAEVSAGKPLQVDITLSEPGDFSTLLKWDEDIFGASRERLLGWYHQNGQPFLVLGEPLRGYVAGRQGSDAFQVGPLVAGDDEAAHCLLQSVLSLVEEQNVIADILTPNSAMASILTDAGFQRFRVLQRMYRGVNQYPGRPDRVYCAAGFEFG